MLFFGGLILGCSKPFLIENFASDYQPNIETLAIAPFANPGKKTDEPNPGDTLRKAIYRQLRKEENSYSVYIQALAESDHRLAEARIDEAAALQMPEAELCRILGVDAVMKGKVKKYAKGYHSPMSSTIIPSRRSEIEAEIFIFDRRGGRALWGGGIVAQGRDAFDPPSELLDGVGKKIAKEFPFKKGKK